MVRIIEAGLNDAKLLTELARSTFIEAHSEAAPAADLEAYMDKSLSLSSLTRELEDDANVFHLVYYDRRPAGYSKIIPDTPHPKIDSLKICKLERLYIQQEFYDKRVGFDLLEFNIDLSKKLHQVGMWLGVWVGNVRAIRFYQRAGFESIGETYFKVSDTHENLNYWMYRKY
jgi:GNAT superfamily N-acetyltransferase